MTQNAVRDKSIEFSLDIIKYAELLEAKRKFVVANQILRSGTSIGANICEAQNAESRRDFLHKFKIASKELEETKYWLVLCQRSENYPDIKDLDQKAKELGLIVFKIISTTIKRLNKNN